MVGYVFDKNDDFDEKVRRVGVEKKAERVSAENRKGWLFRDPLRGFSVDRWPYSRCEGELRLDFIFKAGAIYGPCLALTAILESPVFFVLVGLWFTINFIRRNG